MKLLDRVRQTRGMPHFSYRTEQAYSLWIVQFIRFQDVRHPNTMGGVAAGAPRRGSPRAFDEDRRVMPPRERGG